MGTALETPQQIPGTGQRLVSMEQDTVEVNQQGLGGKTVHAARVIGSPLDEFTPRRTRRGEEREEHEGLLRLTRVTAGLAGAARPPRRPTSSVVSSFAFIRGPILFVEAVG
jgi:hypothetical protein